MGNMLKQDVFLLVYNYKLQELRGLPRKTIWLGETIPKVF